MNEPYFESFSEMIQTKRLSLRRFSKNDFEFFKEITSDDLVQKYFKDYHELSDKITYFKNQILKKQSSKTLYLIITSKETSKPLGFINLIYDVNKSNWFLEYALLKSFRGNGYILELLDAIIFYFTEFMICFKTNFYSIPELHLEIKQDNLSSKRVITKLINKRGYTISTDNDNIYLQV